MQKLLFLYVQNIYNNSKINDISFYWYDNNNYYYYFDSFNIFLELQFKETFQMSDYLLDKQYY
jgi:hypothetical protein